MQHRKRLDDAYHRCAVEHPGRPAWGKHPAARDEPPHAAYHVGDEQRNTRSRPPRRRPRSSQLRRHASRHFRHSHLCGGPDAPVERAAYDPRWRYSSTTERASTGALSGRRQPEIAIPTAGISATAISTSAHTNVEANACAKGPAIAACARAGRCWSVAIPRSPNPSRGCRGSR